MNTIELTHESIANLLSIALSGNANLGVTYAKRHEHLCKSDCLEDKLADILVGGGRIVMYDAEDPSDLQYRQKLDLQGLQAGLDCARSSDDADIRHAYECFVQDDLDATTADTLLQVILYGEVHW